MSDHPSDPKLSQVKLIHRDPLGGIGPGSEMARLAGSYLSYLLEPSAASEGELSTSERAFVLWDWEGLASLAYRQFLKFGRGVLIGPRMVMDAEHVTIAFDYVANSSGAVPRALGVVPDLDPFLDHYHPDFEFVVAWLRKDGTVRFEVLRAEDWPRCLAPREIHEREQSVRRPWVC